MPAPSIMEVDEAEYDEEDKEWFVISISIK